MKSFITLGKRIIVAGMLAAMTCSAFVACETYDDTEIKESIKNLENRIKALESQVAENIAALQSMISLGSISSCEYDAETGKAVIKLKDGQTITIGQTVKGISLLTVVEKEGKYYWGICKDDSVELLVINGKNVPVEVTPAAKISEQGEWLLSADGGLTWVATGIFQNISEGGSEAAPEPEVVFFQDVKLEGDYLILTLADGKVVKVRISGDSSFTAAESSLWFTRTEEEKMVALSMTDVKAFTITEKPEGWKAYIEEDYLHIISPVDPSSAANKGTIKILAVFNSGADPEIVSVEVQYEAEITLESDSFGTVKVSVSEHVDESYPGYIIKAWKATDFTEEAAVAWLNGDGKSATPHTEGKSFNIKDLADNFASDASYVIFATSYIPARLVISGERQYTQAGLMTAAYSPAPMGIGISDVSYDSALVSASFTGIDSYYAGISSTEDWDNYIKDNVLEMLGWGGMTPLTAASYNGPAEMFPDGNTNITILPSTQYTVWVIPVKQGNMYNEGDIMTKTFKTSAIKSDVSVATPTINVHSVTYGGFTADVTPGNGTYKTYANILNAASIPDNDLETVAQLIKGNKYSKGNGTFSVSTNSFNSDSEVYILAVSISEDGRFGKIVKEKVDLKELSYTDAVAVTDCGVEYGVGDVTLTLSFKGTPSTISYMTASYTYYTLDMIEKLMAMSQLGDVMDKDIKSLTDGNKVELTGLDIGVPYTFYAVVKDADGVPSHIYTKEFIPTITVDYVMSTDANYSYGMPQLSGKWNGENTYILNVKKPAECVKYWLYRGDPEYFTGDPWTDTDKLVGSQLYGVETHTESIEGKTYTTMYDEARLYFAWLDNKGNYHAINEFNPHN